MSFYGRFRSFCIKICLDLHPICQSGGIGRHVGFKIQCLQEREGSSPSFGTKPESIDSGFL